MQGDAARETRKSPWDFEAWLALGLANTRLLKAADAAVAFDSALVLMSPVARDSFTNIARLLPRAINDSSGVVHYDAGLAGSQSPAAHKAAEDMYWLLADPLSKTKLNENRVEFYSRVAFADMRWTSDDLDMRGADTDRGDIFVRYGPADRESLISCNGMQLMEDANSVAPDVKGADEKWQVWVYNLGKVFIFKAPPSFGTATIPLNMRGIIHETINAEPVRWDNVAATAYLDTMSVRFTRFRAGIDSLDLVTAIAIPVERMMKGTELGGKLPFDINVRAYDPQVRISFEDSISTFVNADSLPSLMNRTWVRRLGHNADVMRIDAYQPDTKRAARGLGMVDDQRPTDFGMSDILLGNALSDYSGSAKRWRDVGLTPTVGFFHLSDPVGLVWELYKLQAKEGVANYNVDISVERVGEPGLKAFTMQILGRFKEAVKGVQAAEKVSLSFDRSQPANEVLVDYLSLAFGNVKAGNYRMFVTITDKATNKYTINSTMIRFIP